MNQNKESTQQKQAGRPSVLTEEQKSKILEFSAQGLSYSEISKLLDINRGSVYYLLKRSGKI